MPSRSSINGCHCPEAGSRSIYASRVVHTTSVTRHAPARTMTAGYCGRSAAAMLNFAGIHVSMPRNQGGKPCPGWTPTASAFTSSLADNGPSVVLLHEMGGTLDSWDGIFPALSERFRTLRYDQRGSGLSEKVRQPITTEILEEDLEAVLQESGLPPPYHFVTVAAATMQALHLHDQASRSRRELRVLQSVHRRRSEPGGRARAARGPRRARGPAQGHSDHARQFVAARYRRPRGLRDLSRALPGARSGLLRLHEPGDRAAQRDASRQGDPAADHGGGRPLRQGAAARRQRAVRADHSRRALRADRRRAHDAGAGGRPAARAAQGLPGRSTRHPPSQQRAS